MRRLKLAVLAGALALAAPGGARAQDRMWRPEEIRALNPAEARRDGDDLVTLFHGDDESTRPDNGDVWVLLERRGKSLRACRAEVVEGRKGRFLCSVYFLDLQWSQDEDWRRWELRRSLPKLREASEAAEADAEKAAETVNRMKLLVDQGVETAAKLEEVERALADAQDRLAAARAPLDGAERELDERFPEIRIAAVEMGRREDAPQVTLAAFGKAEAALADWAEHRNFLPEALQEDPAKSRDGWAKVAASLERAREAHPEHLGILQDLIGAYAHLNAYEAHTARGTNLCALIPQRIAEFEIAAGQLTWGESRAFGRILGVYYFQIGLYPCAMWEAAWNEDDPEMEPLWAALGAIGQDDFNVVETFAVEGEAGVDEVQVVESVGEDAGVPRVRWFFLVKTQDGCDAPGRVWFEGGPTGTGAKPRWELVGCTANLRRVMEAYGEEEPDLATLKERVSELVAAGLRKPEGGK